MTAAVRTLEKVFLLRRCFFRGIVDLMWERDSRLYRREDLLGAAANNGMGAVAEQLERTHSVVVGHCFAC